MDKLLKFILNLISSIFSGTAQIPDNEDWYEPPYGDAILYTGKMLCSCGCKEGTHPKLEKVLKNMIEVIYYEYGRYVEVSSGYRCTDYNKKVGGATNSQHIKWPIQAADIRVEGIDAKEMYKRLDASTPLKRAGIGIGYYLDTKTGREFLHIDSRGYNARWLRIDGTYLKATSSNLNKYSLT